MQIFSIRVAEYNFSETQSGKDVCDSKTSICRLHISKHAGEGQDIMNCINMKTALEPRWSKGNKGMQIFWKYSTYVIILMWQNSIYHPTNYEMTKSIFSTLTFNFMDEQNAHF